MDPIRIQLAVAAITLMLVYLLGDVLRIYDNGNGVKEKEETPISKKMMLLASSLLLIPIILALGSVFLPILVVKWSSIVGAIILFSMNISGIMVYKSLYDKILLIISLFINIIIFVLAFTYL